MNIVWGADARGPRPKDGPRTAKIVKKVILVRISLPECSRGAEKYHPFHRQMAVNLLMQACSHDDAINTHCIRYARNAVSETLTVLLLAPVRHVTVYHYNDTRSTVTR